MRRIAVAGFQHETNTFAPEPATMADFRMADSFPPLLEGEAVLAGTRNTSLPMGGFLRAATGVEIVPLAWASAEPSGRVRDDAYETISAMILDGVARAGPIDGIYLDLHGAMVTQSHEDGEGELLARLRALVGAAMPIVASLDNHANVSDAMVDHASALTLFRTYPHLDMAETGARAFRALTRLMDGEALHGSLRRVPFLLALPAQCTDDEPLRSIVADIRRQDTPDAWSDLALGFPAADVPFAGPAALAYARTPEEADARADALLTAMLEAEPRFDARLHETASAVRQALATATRTGRPVVLADVQDNPGGGGSSDTTGLLRALVAGQADGAVLGMLCDGEAARAAHAAGVGATFDLALGGRGTPGDEPFRARWTVEALSDGRFAFADEMYAGGTAEAGPCALLRLTDGPDVRAVVSTHRCQALDRACFTHLGVMLEETRMIAVKSTIHHRAAFGPLAADMLAVVAPGLLPCRLEDVAYRRLRTGVRFAG